MKIITLTVNPAVDISVKVKQVVPEKKLRCSVPKIEPGGGGINVSRAIKKLDGESLAVYPSGGTTGELLKNLLDDEEIKQKNFSIDGMTRESFTASEENSDQQFRFVLPGPEIKKNEWENILEEIHKIKGVEFLVASGSLSPSLPEDFYAEAAKIGKELNAKVFVDTSGKPLHHAVEEGVFLIKPNMNEIKALLEEDFKNESHVADAAQKMISSGKTEVVVVSLGSGGALLITKDICTHLRAPVVEIKSKVGAGDSTVAGIVLHLSKGNSIKESVLYGIAAGASAVMTPGSELCRKDDTNRLFDRLLSNDQRD